MLALISLISLAAAATTTTAMSTTTGGFEADVVTRRSYDACEWYDFNGCCDSKYCPRSSIGDGICDSGCMFTWCEFDNGDCDGVSDAAGIMGLAKASGQLACHFSSNVLVHVVSEFVAPGAADAVSAACSIADQTVFKRRDTQHNVDNDRLLSDLKARVADRCYASGQHTPACASRIVAQYVADKMVMIRAAFQTYKQRNLYNDLSYTLSQHANDASVYPQFASCTALPEDKTMHQCIEAGIDSFDE